MTLRRYSPLQPSSGTRWPPEVARAIRERDGGCVGPRVEGWPTALVLFANHRFGLSIDHVRASGGLSMKSPSVASNGAQLCFGCHAWKTEHGREARPLLLAYLSRFAS